MYRSSVAFLLIAGMLAVFPPPSGAADQLVVIRAPDKVMILPPPAGQEKTAWPRGYPADLLNDIPWSAGTSGVADIQAAFNNARTQENSQLGTSVPAMSLPSQSTWDGYSDSEKALWLVNQERVARSLAPWHGVDSNVQAVAQAYASYLLSHNAAGHYADGKDPWQRMNENPAINACHDFLSVGENIGYLVTTGSSIPLPVERAFYYWMYTDATSAWGHRHAILWTPFTENSAPSDREGLMGIGRANGGPYQGSFTSSWPFAEIIVMNVFDPCSTWQYSGGGGTEGLRPGAGATHPKAPFSIR